MKFILEGSGWVTARFYPARRIREEKNAKKGD
jgi:hypothetical protein